MAARRVDHRRVLPDPGSYEERYRLAGDVGWTLFGTLAFAVLGSVWHTSVAYTVFALGVGTLAARAGGGLRRGSPCGRLPH